MEEIIKNICLGKGLHYISSQPVHGGDINRAYAVDTNNGRFFLKLNDAGQYPFMFEKEAGGLSALEKSTSLKVPEPVAYGKIESYQYLLMEWIEKGNMTSSFWERFAAGLAELHKTTHLQFGWSSSNYIGSLLQLNECKNEWSEFYTMQRIMPLAERLYNESSFTKADMLAAEQHCKRWPGIFPEEPAALLHGDLWSGNFMIAANGKPAIFDPAVYYGHREMDIGMTLLFGGFDRRFYEAYNEVCPLEKDWRKRVPLTQLYPLLVHAVLFGGGYVEQCRRIISG